MNHRRIAAEGVRHALVATMVAVVGTFFVYAFGFGAIGENLSQRALVSMSWGNHWLSPLAFAPQRSRAAIDVPYVFVDVPLNNCSALASNERKPCRIRAPLKGAELAKLLASVRDAGPRLVIVDALVAGSAADPEFAADDRGRAGMHSAGLDQDLHKEFDRQTNAITQQALPPILVGWTVSRNAWESNKDGEVASVSLYEADLQLFDPTTFKAARFFPALVNGGHKADLLLPSLCVYLPKAIAKRREGYAITPTLAAAAAILLRAAPGQDPLAKLQDYPVSVESRKFCSTSALPNWDPAKTFAKTKRTLSASPSARQGPEDLNPDLLPPAKVLDGGSWSRLPAPAVAASGLGLARLKGAVVIIGTSEPDPKLR